jgi:transposase
LWREYLATAPDGYRYTQFVARFREWQGAHKEPRLLRTHTPGEMVEIDYAGMTLSVGVGAAARPAQVFVAVLPYSGYLFADVTWSQQSADWLASHVLSSDIRKCTPGDMKTAPLMLPWMVSLAPGRPSAEGRPGAFRAGDSSPRGS